jgi:FtsP/CotA-like multicopper oxidase with cupredoxin domain
MFTELSKLGFVPSRWMAAAGFVTALACGTQPVSAANFVDPVVFASSNGLLDIMMIAKPKAIPTISFRPPAGGPSINPTGWVYEICKRPASGYSCPPGTGTVADYGGVRLALQKGDTLKIRYVNKLPRVDPAKLTHVSDPGEANLYLNPSNLHTHGLLVPARAATVGDPTFGDFVFVTIFNSANGIPVPQATHQHGPIVMDTVDFRIDIPANHPSGLFWFHPHVHGIALNQVSEGLAGIITIGKVGDYAMGDAVSTPFPDSSVRHMTLKDIEVLAAGTVNFDAGPAPVANGEVLNQEDPDFRAQLPTSPAEVRHGSCPGQDNSADGGNNFTGGKWYFTVSGQQYPTIRMTNPDGEVWRLTNASGSLSYDLQLINDADRKPMVMQLLAVDGVSVHLPQDTPMGSMIQMAGGKFRVVACPSVQTIGLHSLPICVNELVMMPSARAELWVTYRASGDRVGPPPAGATATFKMIGLTMGSGDQWPAVDLAAVEFAQTGPRKFTSNALDIQGDALASMQSAGIFSAANPKTGIAALPAGCSALPPGHRRRIFFGFQDVAVDGTFALGYEEVDQNGNVVPGTQRPVQQFDPSHNSVCLPLGAGQTPVHETWELIQLSTENHNFHIHQARFRVTDASAPSSSPLAMKANSSNGGGIIQDNIPLGVAVPHIPQVNDSQNGVCTIAQWRSGQCSSTPVVVDIPFSQVGEFVYHCHILEHEDGGMMAKIQVVPSPN